MVLSVLKMKCIPFIVRLQRYLKETVTLWSKVGKEIHIYYANALKDDS